MAGALRVSIGIGGPASGRNRDFRPTADFVREAERLGVDCVWTAEAWGQDAVTPLAYLAAVTETIHLGSGIMQISARAPVMTAMTALTMASLSNNRFVLGLGASGPQVVEGLHGVPFAKPLTRMRETIAIIRQAFAGEKIAFDGQVHKLPLPGGQGKALRLSQPPNPDIPIYLATLAPASRRFTGEAADGWLGTSFTPEAAGAHLDHIREGAAAAGRDPAAIDIQAGGAVAFGDREALAAPFKQGLAFQLGAMGSATTNFYNDAWRRGGWAEDAEAVQALWVAGKRDEAVARVPDGMVLQGNLLGTPEEVAERVRAYRDAGVTTLRLQPAGATLDEQLDTLGQAMDVVAAANGDASD